MSDSRGTGPLNELNRLIRENRVGDYSSPNLALGMAPVEFGPGTSRWLWRNQPPAALNPFGTLQGGYIALFIDELLSTAIGSVLAEDEWAVTVEFKISFLRALRPGQIEGAAKVVRRTRTLAFMEVQVQDEAGHIAASASATWAISRR